MPRRPASITQADVVRIIRAAKQAAAREISCASDSATVASIALHHGGSRRRALTRNGNGVASGLFGVLLDLLAAENQGEVVA